MPNSYYASNSKITGGALFASWNSKDGAVFLKLLKQIANNSDKRNNFDGANPINIKLSQDEAADIIRAIRTNGESKFYHKFNETVTSGSFKFYTIPAKDTFPAKSGFGLSVKRTQNGKETEIKVGFTLASAERLSLFLKNALTHCFDSEYSDDLKKAKEYNSKKAKTETTTAEPDKAPEADEVPAPDVEF